MLDQINNIKTTQRGFTVIDFVVVIIAVSIIAAIALPKYSALVKQSRLAVFSAVQSSVTSLSALTNALASGANIYAMTNGTIICLKNGYPDVVDGTGCKSICSFINLAGVQCFPGHPDNNTATFKFSNDVANCNLQYFPTITGPDFRLASEGC